MRIAAVVIAIVGACLAGGLGVLWARDAGRFEADVVAYGAAADVDRLLAAACVLIAALGLGCLGGALCFQGRGRLAGSLLLAAGVAPGMLEPKAFVVTFVLIVAGLLAYGTVPQRCAPSTR